MTVAKRSRGQSVRFPRHRRIVLDVCEAARTVPAFAVDRHVDLTRVMNARRSTPQRIGWAAIFAKAYSLVAAESPALRQTFVTYPWPRLYQHPDSVVSIAVNRFDPELDAERLSWVRVRAVESLTLSGIQEAIDSHQQSDAPEKLRERDWVESMPRPLRRIAWHVLMRWAGRRRAKLLGTFSLSTLASYGTTNHAHPLVVTASLSYGPLDEDGCSLVTLQADHRVLDGAAAARALVRLDEVLRGEIVEELFELHRTVRRAA